jgi:acyl carrier protein
MNDIKEWLYDFISKREGSTDIKGKLTDSTDIFESGIMDSLGIVELLTGIESRFNIELTLDSLEINRFNSIQDISEIIFDKLKNR